MTPLHCPSDEAREVCRVLGLDPKLVTGLTLRMRPSDVVTVHARLLVSAEQAEGLKQIWRDYVLVPRSQVAPQQP